MLPRPLSVVGSAIPSILRQNPSCVACGHVRPRPAWAGASFVPTRSHTWLRLVRDESTRARAFQNSGRLAYLPSAGPRSWQEPCSGGAAWLVGSMYPKGALQRGVTATNGIARNGFRRPPFVPPKHPLSSVAPPFCTGRNQRTRRSADRTQRGGPIQPHRLVLGRPSVDPSAGQVSTNYLLRLAQSGWQARCTKGCFAARCHGHQRAITVLPSAPSRIPRSTLCRRSRHPFPPAEIQAPDARPTEEHRGRLERARHHRGAAPAPCSNRGRCARLADSPHRPSAHALGLADTTPLEAAPAPDGAGPLRPSIGG